MMDGGNVPDQRIEAADGIKASSGWITHPTDWPQTAREPKIGLQGYSTPPDYRCSQSVLQYRLMNAVALKTQV